MPHFTQLSHAARNTHLVHGCARMHVTVWQGLQGAGTVSGVCLKTPLLGHNFHFLQPFSLLDD